MRGKKANLIGKKFGRLTVIKLAYIKGNTYWKCKCDCGNYKITRGTHLITKRTTSCGCYNTEQVKKANTKHGLCKTRFYNIWGKIKNRCFNKNNNRYYLYGKRGIIICNKWLKFENFRNDMYDSYLKHCKKFGKKNTSIDRIDGNKNYTPNNCRWATPIIQRHNRIKK